MCRLARTERDTWIIPSPPRKRPPPNPPGGQCRRQAVRRPAPGAGSGQRLGTHLQPPRAAMVCGCPDPWTRVGWLAGRRQSRRVSPGGPAAAGPRFRAVRPAGL